MGKPTPGWSVGPPPPPPALIAVNRPTAVGVRARGARSLMIACECHRDDAHRSTSVNGEGCLGAVCRLLWWFNGQGGLDVRPHLMRGHLLTATVRCRGGGGLFGSWRCRAGGGGTADVAVGREKPGFNEEMRHLPGNERTQNWFGAVGFAESCPLWGFEDATCSLVPAEGWSVMSCRSRLEATPCTAARICG